MVGARQEHARAAWGAWHELGSAPKRAHPQQRLRQSIAQHALLLRAERPGRRSRGVAAGAAGEPRGRRRGRARDIGPVQNAQTALGPVCSLHMGCPRVQAPAIGSTSPPSIYAPGWKHRPSDCRQCRTWGAARSARPRERSRPPPAAARRRAAAPPRRRPRGTARPAQPPARRRLRARRRARRRPEWRRACTRIPAPPFWTADAADTSSLSLAPAQGLRRTPWSAAIQHGCRARAAARRAMPGRGTRAPAGPHPRPRAGAAGAPASPGGPSRRRRRARARPRPPPAAAARSAGAPPRPARRPARARARPAPRAPPRLRRFGDGGRVPLRAGCCV